MGLNSIKTSRTSVFLYRLVTLLINVLVNVLHSLPSLTPSLMQHASYASDLA